MYVYNDFILFHKMPESYQRDFCEYIFSGIKRTLIFYDYETEKIGTSKTIIKDLENENFKIIMTGNKGQIIGWDLINFFKKVAEYYLQYIWNESSIEKGFTDESKALLYGLIKFNISKKLAVKNLKFIMEVVIKLIEDELSEKDYLMQKLKSNYESLDYRKFKLYQTEILDCIGYELKKKLISFSKQEQLPSIKEMYIILISAINKEINKQYGEKYYFIKYRDELFKIKVDYIDKMMRDFILYFYNQRNDKNAYTLSSIQLEDYMC